MGHNIKPDINPICCYRMATWVVQSPSVAYFYCVDCKKEVDTPYNTKKRERYAETLDTNKKSRVIG